MKITDIKQQVKRQDRYSIYIDDAYRFSLSENELMNLGLRIDQEFDKAELEELQKTAAEDKAYMQAINLLSRRPRSVYEMQQYLTRKEYDKKTVEKLLNTLSNRGLLDDEKFARSWVESRRLLKKTSKRRLMLELQQKRIPIDIINTVLEEDQTDEQAVIRELIARKRTQSRYQDKQKLTAYLSRQGFNYQDIKTALEES